MDILPPKSRSIVCIFICILAALIIALFTDLNIVIVVEILLLIPGFILSYILSIKLDIRISHYIFYIILFFSLLLVSAFNQSNIALNIFINDWEKSVMKKLDNECLSTCTVSNKAIYDENNNVVYSWRGLSQVGSGEIRKNGDLLEYKISYKNKCIIKELNNEHKVSKTRCN